MRLLLSLLIIFITSSVFFACKTKKEITKNLEEKTTINNPLASFCICKNSKGLTIEEYGLKESKKAKLSAEEYAETVKIVPGSWLLTEFITDPTYMEAVEVNFKALGGKDAFKDSEAVEQAIKELEAKYPICGRVSTMMVTGLVGSK